ncbi:unnamed protein product, partial [Chrysoparadoxa australica]
MLSPTGGPSEIMEVEVQPMSPVSPMLQERPAHHSDSGWGDLAPGSVQGLKKAESMYDISRTHFHDRFFGCVTILTLAGTILLITAIVIFTATDLYTEGGPQDSLLGATVNSKLDIVGASGHATLTLQSGGGGRGDAFSIVSERAQGLDFYHGGTEESLLSLDTDGDIQSLGVLTAKGVTSSEEGFTFPDGSVMSTAASVSTGSSSPTDLNLVAGTSGLGSIQLSVQGKERIRIDGEGNTFFRANLADTNSNATDSLVSGVVVKANEKVIVIDEDTTISSSGLTSTSPFNIASPNLALGQADGSTALGGALVVDASASVSIASDRASFLVSTQATLNALSTPLPVAAGTVIAGSDTDTTLQPSPHSAKVFSTGAESACADNALCLEYTGTRARSLSVSLMLEDVRITREDGVYEEPPYTVLVKCQAGTFLSTTGIVFVTDNADYATSITGVRHEVVQTGD